MASTPNNYYNQFEDTMQAVVIGGGGFLGSKIAHLLLKRGDHVRVVGRHYYPHLSGAGAYSLVADINDPTAMVDAVKNADAVFLTAAHAGYWGKLARYWKINVDGTRTVLDGVKKCGVPRLIYTSTPSVVGYQTEVENANNDLPYPSKHESPYPETKGIAERLILAANGPGLATVALRPHIIFGPGDRHVLPRMIDKAVSGKLMQIGNGTNMVDMTYIDNAAAAHLDAAAALANHQAPCAGKAYFISNNEPVRLWDFLNTMLSDIGFPTIDRSISLRTGRILGRICEMGYHVLPLRGEPPITRYLASMLARAHWYDMTPAMRDLGYRVRVSMAEGTRATLDWLRAERPWETWTTTQSRTK